MPGWVLTWVRGLEVAAEARGVEGWAYAVVKGACKGKSVAIGSY